MTEVRHFVFAGGGSGGHLTPSIAVAGQLLQLAPDSAISFLTSGRKIDQLVLSHSPLADDDRCEIIALPLTQPPTARLSALRHLIALWKSLQLCRACFRQRPVSAVMGTGAFASVPGLMTARHQKVPMALFEANAVPGRVNRWWSRHAGARFGGWAHSQNARHQGFEVVGMPTIADTCITATSPTTRQNHQLLVVGGSQGSRRLNELVVEAVMATGLPADWTVLHQTGGLEHPNIWPSALLPQVTTTNFIESLPQAISESTIVISRAGAVTLAEIAAVGCPAILIPLSHSAHGHQSTNAEHFAAAGAAMTIDETKPGAAGDLADALHSLLNDETVRIQMQRHSRTLHRPGAAELIARRLLEMTEQCETR